MFFNLDRCKVVFFGTRHSKYVYNLRGEPLQLVEEGKDRAVIVPSDAKPSKQCEYVRKRVNMILGFTGRKLGHRLRECYHSPGTSSPGIYSAGLVPQLQKRI